MMEMMEEELEVAGFNVSITVRIDEEDEKKLDKIALYERTKRGALLRRWIHERIRTFYHNPEYKRWLRDLKGLNLIPLREAKKKK